LARGSPGRSARRRSTAPVRHRGAIRSGSRRSSRSVRPGRPPGRNRVSTVAAAPRRYVVHAYPDIAGVDPHEWNAFLAPEDFHAMHRFIGVCQRSGVADAAYRHITVHDAGQLVAIASFSRMQVALDLLSNGIVRGVTRTLRQWREGFFRVPVAFCGLPVSFGQSSVRIRPGSDAPAIAGLIAEELERWAKSHGTALLCFKEFAPGELPLVEPLA